MAAKKEGVKALTDMDIRTLVKWLKIPHFRGVYMRDELRGRRPRRNEYGIINLDGKQGPGTHWTAFFKRGKNKTYFDPIGDIKPPKELIAYLGPNIYYNTNRFQEPDDETPICGHLSLIILSDLSGGGDYQEILNQYHG